MIKKITILEVVIVIVLIIIVVKLWKYSPVLKQKMGPTPVLQTVEPYLFVTKWGRKGICDGEFYGPWAIAVDSKRNIYVGDRGNYRIQKFNCDGKFIAKWGSKGNWDDFNHEKIPLAGEFSNIVDICVDSNDNIYVNDGNERIQKFDSDGDFLGIWGKMDWDNYKKFNSAGKMAISLKGNIYMVIVDDILKFNSDWNLMNSWEVEYKPRDSEGVKTNVIHFLGDITTDIEENIYVVFTMPWPSIKNELNLHSSIYKFNSSGKLITQWDDALMKDEYRIFSYIEGMSIDSNNRIFITDTGRNRIMILDTDGNVIAHWGTKGNEDGQFRGPVDIAIDCEGNIYVADYENNRVQKFKPNPDFKFN